MKTFTAILAAFVMFAAFVPQAVAQGVPAFDDAVQAEAPGEIPVLTAPATSEDKPLGTVLSWEEVEKALQAMNNRIVDLEKRVQALESQRLSTSTTMLGTSTPITTGYTVSNQGYGSRGSSYGTSSRFLESTRSMPIVGTPTVTVYDSMPVQTVSMPTMEVVQPMVQSNYVPPAATVQTRSWNTGTVSYGSTGSNQVRAASPPRLGQGRLLGRGTGCRRVNGRWVCSQ